jgi:hypothetical protein
VVGIFGAPEYAGIDLYCLSLGLLVACGHEKARLAAGWRHGMAVDRFGLAPFWMANG